MFKDEYDIDLSQASPKEKETINTLIKGADHFEKNIPNFAKLAFGFGGFSIAVGCTYLLTKGNPLAYSETMRLGCNLTLMNAAISMCDYSLQKSCTRAILLTAKLNDKIKIKKK